MLTYLISRIPTIFAIDCNADRSGRLFGLLPKWYAYIKDYTSIPGSGGQFSQPSCGIVGGAVTDHLLAIGLAVVDGLLRVGGVVAVVFVIYGGIRYITSQGEPENTKAALSTIINAFIGLVIVIISTAVVHFVGSSLG